MGRIRHCNKNQKTEFEYTLLDYPHKGAKMFLKAGVCSECNHTAYTYQTEYNYGRSSEIYPWQQADKTKRFELDQVIRVGTCQIIQKDVREKDDKQEKPEPIVGEYTRRIKRPAEESISYLDKVKKAESNDISSLDTLLLCG